MGEARISRQTDYDRFSPSAPIVIDNGGSFFRIGWAGERDPRVMFRNIALRPRHRSTGETVTVVGEQDPALLKYFDCTRSSWRSPFDNNVVYQFEIMEYVLDYGFDRLGASSSLEGKVDHPILMTECICNPVYSRSKMAELLFETYGVPSIAFGVDSIFGYKYNQNLGICNEDGIALSIGFNTTHSIPFLNGEPIVEGAARTNVGGFHATNYLKELLSLKYPLHSPSITWEKAEELKREHCYVVQDYAAELQLFKNNMKEAEEKKRVWQLPFVPAPLQEVAAPSEEEIARKAAIKEKQGQRLREMAAAKRSQKILDLERELDGLEGLLSQLDDADSPEHPFQPTLLTLQIQNLLRPAPQELVTAPSEEEIAIKAAIKEKQGQRLREMAVAKRSQKFLDLGTELDGLEGLLSELDDTESPEEASGILARSGFLSRQEIESSIARATQSLRKAKGEPSSATGEDKLAGGNGEDKYPLISVPDDMLTPDQMKEKKRQVFLKTTAEGRMRAKQKRSEEEMMREKQNQLEEERRLENPELYLEEMRAKYKELSEKLEQRKRLKTNGNGNNNNNNGNGNNNNNNNNVGRGERLNAAQRERMRLLTTAAFDRGKGEDTFGQKDEDWQLYKLMSRDNDDDDDVIDPDDTELARISSKLQEIDPTFISEPLIHSANLDAPAGPRVLTAEDYQVVLGVERFRCPEVLFQPGIVGEYQSGIHELVAVSLSRLSLEESVKDRMCNSVLVTGGGSLLAGTVERLEAEIRGTRPYMSPLRLIRAKDAVLDAWRGASVYANSEIFSGQTFTLEDYNEKGEDWLRRYNIVYNI